MCSAAPLYSLALVATQEYNLKLDELPNSIKLDVLKSCCLSIDMAAEKGHLDCVKFAFEKGGVPTSKTCSVAAGRGHLEILKYLRKQNCPWDKSTTKMAAGQGHLECLKYLHKNGCPWDECTFKLAAWNGKLECMKYLHKHGCEWDLEICQRVILCSNLECVKYVFESMNVLLFCKSRHPAVVWWTREHLCVDAAEAGNLDCLKYFAEKQKFPVTGNVLHFAAANGHLECLKYAYQKFNWLWLLFQTPWTWHEDTCCEAARGGHLECLKFAHENGCPWNKATCLAAARYGHFECLKYAHENGCPWDDDTIALSAARCGHLECLKYAHENGCPWDDETIALQTVGSADCLKYVHRHGALLTTRRITRKAAENCHWDSLRYAIENECPMDMEVCFFALFRDCDLNMLQFLHERGAFWHTRNCIEAGAFAWDGLEAIARRRRIDCPEILNYILEHDCGCPV
jgi:hypothetical protein